jgi:hypothetical protein
MSKPIATTMNDPSAKMRGLSIGIFPDWSMACAQRPQECSRRILAHLVAEMIEHPCVFFRVLWNDNA